MSEFSDYVDKPVVAPREPLTSKRAVELLLEGTLKVKVCKYCLNVTSALTDLDQYLKVTGEAGFYKVTVKDMVACFYPYQVKVDTHLPDKVCEDCLDHIVNCYLFTQQCERADRALRNCFEEINEKVEKLDPLIRPTTRGRRKANPNTNKINISYKRVIDYADPLMSLVSQGTDMEKADETKVNELECPKCWQEFNNIEALLNHKKSHPNTMWFYCKFCGLSFAKENFYRKHLNTAHAYQIGAMNKSPTSNSFKCNECGAISKNYSSQLQHIEKHKFKGVIEAVLDKKLDHICSICFEKGRKMVEMNSTVHFRGGYPGLSGYHNLYNVMDSSLPTRKSRYKYRELLLSNTAKILRMKRKSDMMEDTLNTTKFDSNISHDDRSSRSFTYLPQNEDKKASQTNSSISGNESAKNNTDDLTEFTFSMPLIIPAKRRKLDLKATELSNQNISLTSQKPKKIIYHRPNFFLFNHSAIKRQQNESEDNVDRRLQNNLCEDKHDYTNNSSLTDSPKNSDEVIEEIDVAQNKLSEEDSIEEKIDKSTPDNLDLSNINSVNKNIESINGQDDNKNFTKDISVSCNSSYEKNTNKDSTEIVPNNIRSHEWSFSRASVIVGNISPSILKIVQQELSKDSGLHKVEFTFHSPIKYTDNGKKHLSRKSLNDGDMEIEKDTEVKEKPNLKDVVKKNNEEKTQFIPPKDSNLLIDNTRNVNIYKHNTDPITYNFESQSDKDETSKPPIADKKILKTVTENIVSNEIENVNETKINETDELTKSIYPAILRDCIKLPNSNTENNKNDDYDIENVHIESYKIASPFREIEPVSTKEENVKRDMLKQTRLIDNSKRSTSEPLKTIVRKRKCDNVPSTQTKQNWECVYCFTNNEPHRVSCFCCGSVKDSNKFNISINFGTMKKRRFEEEKTEDSPKENEIKNIESTILNKEKESEKSNFNMPIPKTDTLTQIIKPITTSLTVTTSLTTPILSTMTTLSANPLSTTIPSTVIMQPATISSSTTKTPSTVAIPLATTISLTTAVTTSVITTFTIPSNTSVTKTETSTTNPINPIPFIPNTTPLFQFMKSNNTDQIKVKIPTDSSTTPQLTLQPLDKAPQDKTAIPQLTLPNNLETGLNADKNIKKVVKFDDTIKTFNFSDTSNKGIFQFGKPEPKKDVIPAPQLQSEQKFSTLPAITEIAKPAIAHNVLEDIDMTEVADTNINFNTPIGPLPQQPPVLSTIFQTPSTLPKPFGTEQKDTPNAFKAFGNFSTPLSTLTENKPTFDTPVIQSPFTFGNNLNFSIGAAPPDNKGNANAARKTEMRKIRTARRRCN